MRRASVYCSCNGGREIRAPGMDCTNSFGEIISQDILGEIGLDTGHHGAVNIFISSESTQHNKASAWEICVNRDYCLDSGHSRKTHIHERDVGQMLPEEGNRLLPIGCFTDDEHVTLCVDDRTESLAGNQVVFDDHDTDTCG